ncbi:hypothetical protein ABNF65_15175 [Paenibacillus larvae]
MSSKVDRFKNLVRSPNGSKVKEEFITGIKPKKDVKKATFDMDIELHTWLKIYAAKNKKTMVEIIETEIRNLREREEHK